MEIVKKNIPVLEMSCAVCAANVENRVRTVEGVAAASVNFASNQLHVEYDPARVTLLQLQQAVREIGYDLIVDESHAEEEQQQAQQNHYRELKRNTVKVWCFALPLMILGMVFMHERWAAWLMLLLSLPVFLPAVVVGASGIEYLRRSVYPSDLERSVRNYSRRT